MSHFAFFLHILQRNKNQNGLYIPDTIIVAFNTFLYLFPSCNLGTYFFYHHSFINYVCDFHQIAYTLLLFILSLMNNLLSQLLLILLSSDYYNLILALLLGHRYLYLSICQVIMLAPRRHHFFSSRKMEEISL